MDAQARAKDTNGGKNNTVKSINEKNIDDDTRCGRQKQERRKFKDETCEGGEKRNTKTNNNGRRAKKNEERKEVYVSSARPKI